MEKLFGVGLLETTIREFSADELKQLAASFGQALGTKLGGALSGT